MAHVNFAELRNIPIASVLTHYGIEVRKRNNTELVACCPFPSHRDSAHQKDTLAISIEKNRWYCHSDSCRAASNKPKGGDCIDVVAMMENLTPLDAAKKLAELFGGNPQPAKPNDVSSDTPDPPSKGNPPLAFQLKGLDPDHPFIRERGISLETAMAFGVGFFPGKGSMSNRICFPIHEDGSLVGYAGRWVGEPGDEHPKWMLPKGLNRTYLYGLEKCDTAKPVVLLESPWGVLHLFQHKVQAVALIACAMTEAQERRLDPFKEIVVAMDNDTAGHEAAEKIIARLKPNHKVTRAFLKE